MGVAEQVEQKFEKFVVFCKSHLGREGEQIVILINKRYNDCSTHFKNTAAMLDLIKSTKSNMKMEPTRNMVHLKDFLQELKAYKKKRKAQSDTILDRVAKLRKIDDNSSEASTDGIMSDADSNISPDRMKQNNAVTKDSKLDLSKKNDKYSEKTKNKDELHTNDVKISKICDTSKNVSESMETKIKIETVTSIKTVSNSNDTDGDDVVMIEDDHSCIIIDAPSQKSEEHKASLLSFLNLRKTPGNPDSTTDSDVVICDSDIQSPCVNREKATVKAETSNKGEGCKNGDKKSETSDGKKKSSSEKHIKRLESLLERLKNKIEEMRDQELTMDDLDDDTSSYIYEDKLERKFVTVWNKLCEIKGRNRTTGRPAERVFTYGGSRYEELNKKIERMINKYKEFPDFHDVKNVVKKVNKKSNLGLNNSQVDMIARESFLDVGNILQERRQNDFMCTFRCRIQDNFSFERDPALFDVELQRKLDSNQKFGKSNLEDVINKYADKQMYNDRDEVNGDRNKEKQGEGDSHDDEDNDDDDDDDDDDDEEEEDEVEEIIDVDQFVNETEILASYTPSRPAISKNPKLAAFHAQIKQETATDGKEEKTSTSAANIPEDKSEENALPTVVTSSFVAELSSDLDSEQRNYITGNANDGAKTKAGGIFLIDSENKMSSPMDGTKIVLIDSENESVDSMDENLKTSVKADVTDRKHVFNDSIDAKEDNSSGSPVKSVENVNGINLVDSESEDDDNSDKTSKSKMDSNCASQQIVDKTNSDVGLDMELPSPSKEDDAIGSGRQEIDSEPVKSSLILDNADHNISSDSEDVDKSLVIDVPVNDTAENHDGLELNKSIDSENISDETDVIVSEETTMSNINYDSDIEQPTMSKNRIPKSGSDSNFRNNNKDDPESWLVTDDANIDTDSNGIEEDEAVVHDKSQIDESEIKETDVLNLDEDSCSDEDSPSKDSLSMYCELSDDSQSNDCEVIETDDLGYDTSEKKVLSVKPENRLNLVNLPKYLNSPNNVTEDIKNRVSNLVNKAIKNIDESLQSFKNDGDAKNVKIEGVSVNDSDAKSSTYSKDNGMTCSQVSTSSEDYSHKLPYKKTMVAKHLPTNLIKYKSQVVDSFVIEIDEADRLDSTCDQDDDDDDDVCQSTTGKHDLDNNEVSSSICEPDVIILSDSD